MSGHVPNKFPYLILQNISGDKPGSPKAGHVESNPASNRKSDASSKAPPKVSPYPHSMADTQSSGTPNFDFASDGQNQFSAEFNKALNSLNFSQMKAILTAQKELRKPAGSFYPNAAQFSLIPETQLIYKKYFPNEEEKESVGSPKKSPKQKSSSKSPEKEAELKKNEDKELKQSHIEAKSNSEAGAGDNKIVNNNKIVRNQIIKAAVRSASSKEQVSGDIAKDSLNADSRFKRKVHQQLLSMTTEIERQSLELADLKKEVKEMRQATRKSSTENDSSKARLDTLSKHVVDLDSKLDTIQDSISSQEKSILSKLMLIGELSDSDSDLDDHGTLKGLDALSSPSSTKLSFTLSPGSPKKSSSSPVGSSSSSSDFSLPKTCCNWIPIAPDFDKFLHAVALLNYRMDRNQSMKLCSTNNGATFKHSDVIDLTIFKNGIILGSTGFRSYSTMSVIRFINEIFNGYLPTELSTQYPDGVVLVLNDKRSVVHSCDVGFNGSGSKLLAKDDPPDLLPGKASCKAFLNASSRAKSAPLSAASSQTSVKTSSSTFSLSQTGAKYEILPDLPLESFGESLNYKLQTIVLKITHRKTGQKFKLKTPVKATVRALTAHLTASLSERTDLQELSSSEAIEGGRGSHKSAYNIILPLPLGKLSCLESTLEDYGITQNCLVYIQEIET